MIYRSQEPLRILGDLSDDVMLIIQRVPESRANCIKKKFESFNKLEEPLKDGDACHLYANGSFYIIQCMGVG